MQQHQQAGCGSKVIQKGQGHFKRSRSFKKVKVILKSSRSDEGQSSHLKEAAKTEEDRGVQRNTRGYRWIERHHIKKKALLQPVTEMLVRRDKAVIWT